ncbi:MAG: YbjQ family protein [Planctomycetes bacterium]|nr:YbjQ family protein [Planctomycetota bacterium]
MIVTTTDLVPGRAIRDVLGLVRGNTVRAADAHSDLSAWMKNLVGGELAEYTKLLAESREQALDRMREQARALGADAIVGVRIATSEICSGAAELLAYGTAVRLEPLQDRQP